MDFKLNFTPNAPHQLINYKQPLLLTGSCFTQHMANFLQQHFFNVTAQPFGVVFNPISIAQQLLQIIDNISYSEQQLFQYQQLWHTWLHHTSFNGINQNEVLQNINNNIQTTHTLIQNKQTVVVVTFGSAWAYSLANEPHTMVANCQKYPANFFIKQLLSVEQIVTCFCEVIAKLPQHQIVFTVSPVRHIKDGLVENNVSKSILLQAVYHLCNTYQNCYYFPAYELVVDELRDYRFFAKDMVHPNELAIEYVWQKWINTCFDEESKRFVADAAKLQLMLQHKTIHADSSATSVFIQKRTDTINHFIKNYPEANTTFLNQSLYF